MRATPALDAARVSETERPFVAALINHPKYACWWTTAMGPAAIASRRWRAVYEAVGRLAQQERSIDLVMVAAEVRRGSLVHGAGPPGDELGEWVQHGIADNPQYWGRRVAAQRLRRGGHGAAESLRKAAANPGLSVDNLLDTAEIMTVALSEAARLAERPAGTLRRSPLRPPPGALPSAGVG